MVNANGMFFIPTNHFLVRLLFHMYRYFFREPRLFLVFSLFMNTELPGNRMAMAPFLKLIW